MSAVLWQAWTLSGDSYTPHPGDKPWISEMYGYSYGAAKAGVAHEWLEHGLMYPGDPSASARGPSVPSHSCMSSYRPFCSALGLSARALCRLGQHLGLISLCVDAENLDAVACASFVRHE